MNSLRTARRTSLRQRAFTFVELTVASALIGAVALTTLGVLRSGAVLSSQNAGINISSSRAREVVDRINDRARYSMEQPVLINADGSAATGTTADGLLAKRFLGSSYNLKDATGGTTDLAATATQFCLEYRNTLPDPTPGDYILLESVSRPELEIATVTNMTAVGSVLRKAITTTTALGEAVRPSAYRVGGQLYRKEAFIFVATDASSNPRFELRNYTRVVASTVFTTRGTSIQLADGFRRLQSQAFFTRTTSNGATTVVMRALANSSNRQEYVARGMANSTFTTVPIQSRLWSLSR